VNPNYKLLTRFLLGIIYFTRLELALGVSYIRKIHHGDREILGEYKTRE
jgi:hypothetical protein